MRCCARYLHNQHQRLQHQSQRVEETVQIADESISKLRAERDALVAVLEVGPS